MDDNEEVPAAQRTKRAGTDGGREAPKTAPEAQ